MGIIIKDIPLRNGFILQRLKLDGVGGWEEVKDSALTTIGKKLIEGKEVNEDWKRKIVISGHSVIREYGIRFTIKDTYRYVADQLVRHTVGVNNYMATARPDRGNIPRSEQTMDMLTRLKQSTNIQSFLHIVYTRTCLGAVTKETRELIEDLVKIVEQYEPAIGLAAVPPCIKDFGCKEQGFGNGCQYIEKFNNWCKEHSIAVTNIEDRYKAFKLFRHY